MATRIQLRRDTTTNWTNAETVLAAGEVGVERDDTTGVVLGVRVGDGSTPWADLALIAPGATTAAGITFTPAGGVAATDVQAAVEELDQEKATVVALDAKVGLEGDETIAGIKVFSASPVVPTPTTDMQAATKAYVDAGGTLTSPLHLFWDGTNWVDQYTGTAFDNAARTAARPRMIWWHCDAGDEPTWGSNTYDANTTYYDQVDVRAVA